jgi:hypothetical protein
MCRQLSTTENIDANTSVGDCKGAPLLIHATEFVNPQVERPRNVTSPLHFDHIVSDFLVARDEQGQPLSDDRIRQIRNGATWKATVFLNNNQSLNLFTHNAGRPMTSAELRGADWLKHREARAYFAAHGKWPSTESPSSTKKPAENKKPEGSN